MKTTEEMLRKNLKRIVAESVFTSIGAGFSCATMTVFWNSIGMDQTAIGFVQGLVGGSLVAPLQISTNKKTQTSVMSMASTGARLIYIPMVYLSNYLGNIKLQLGLVGVAIIYLPICIAAYILLRKIEKGELQENGNIEEYEQIN